MAAAEDPQLAPHAAKYAQDRQALEGERARQVEALRKRYAAALTAARLDAVKTNKNASVVAIDAEIVAANSEVRSATIPPDLPRTLAGARREFMMGFETLEKTVGTRIKDLNSRYVQTLNTLGQNAQKQGNTALVAALIAEKARIAAGQPATPAAPAKYKNVIMNGDFSTVAEGGLLPAGWQPKGADYQGNNVPWQNDAQVIQAGTEKFLRFRRAGSVRLSNLGPVEPILIPERAKVAVVSAKIRVEGLVPGTNYDRFPSVSIRAFDAAGKSPGPATAAATENTRWRTFTATLTLQPDAKTLDVAVGPSAAAGICDFDDVTVKFE
jgi:hypothetical protein